MRRLFAAAACILLSRHGWKPVTSREERVVLPAVHRSVMLEKQLQVCPYCLKVREVVLGPAGVPAG